MVSSFIFGAFFNVLLAIVSIHAQYQGPRSDCTTPNRLAGLCMSIRQCPPLMALLQSRPLRVETIDFLRQSQCGFDGSDPRVCCPNVANPNTNNPSREREPYPGQNQNNGYQEQPFNPGEENMQLNLANNPLLPTDCGKDLSQKIVGGERTELDEFPWMALLEYRKPNGRTTACGGVLISRRYILTAAHCIKGKDLPDTWRLESVRLGEYDTDSEVDCIQDEDDRVCADDPVSVGVEEQIAHEEYKPMSRDQKYDIALLRLNRDVSFTNFIKPICLPANSSLGQKLYVAGWGKTETRSSSNIKLKLSLPISDKQQCEQTYMNAGVRLGYGQICAGGQRGKDSCRGDSGGPLMAVERTANGAGRWTSVGIVSFGPSPCGTPGWPGVYTKVNDFVPWILSKLRP